MDVLSPISSIKGIGEKTNGYLNKLGVYTIEDILLFFPRTYKQFPDICEPTIENCKSEVAISAVFKTPLMSKKTSKMDISLGTAFSGSVPVEFIWFRAPYVRSQITIGKTYIFFGKLLYENHKFKMEQPQIFEVEKYIALQASFQPIYQLTRGLSNNIVKKSIGLAFETVKIDNSRLPAFVEKRENFYSYDNALKKYHFPESFEELNEARRRLAYEELFYFILNSRLQERKVVLKENHWNIKKSKIVDSTIEKLPFKLTKGQSDALNDILKDITGNTISQRLIQGDVGSGKTMVAYLAMLEVVANGYQAAIMAPTEVLAKQHYETFVEYNKTFGLDYPVALLTGSMKAAERKSMQKIIDEYESCFIIGTHALISEKTNYKQLALVVTDEQHRFGVKQRELLAEKGMDPHMIVMSATPIPRTLAMILYGNMHVSVISELPSNRIPIKTCVIKEPSRKTAFKFIKDELCKGHQAYIVCPLVEASETTEAENVTEYASTLKDEFGNGVSIGILHGKMKPIEKDRIMNSFAKGEIQILVATTVIEVGINVPNATVMMIENANRFGLAQLHQLRGRVGRGSDQSYCILMNSSNDNGQSKRLDTMLKSNDGFVIAKEDLQLRGPGDIFGIRQSGEFSFKIADIFQDAKELEYANSDVDKLLEIDPKLLDHKYVLDSMNSFIRNQSYVL